MLFVRVLAAAVKPAIAGGVVAGAAFGGYTAYDHWHGGDVTAFRQVQQADNQHLLITEFAESRDSIVAVNPDDTSDRSTIATVDHAPGWGIFALLAPDGGAIAYTALPPDTERPSPDSDAQAAIIDTDGDTTLLATDADLLITPVWAPDGDAIVVRTSEPQQDDNGSFELVLLGRDGSRETVTSWDSAAPFPIAFSPDGGTLYFATIGATGTDLYRIARDGTDEMKIAHLTDEVARDWKLSPDGASLAYTVAEAGPQPSIRTVSLDLASGAASVATDDRGRAELNPVFGAEGELTMAAVAPDGQAETLSVDESGGQRALSSAADAVDLPLAWSPDGATLAVRAMEGSTQIDAGAGHIEVLRADGGRERISDDVDALIVGWMP
jgi:Tol biopolymer transport system component